MWQQWLGYLSSTYFPSLFSVGSAAAQAAGSVPAWVFVLAALAWAPGSAFVSAGLSAFASLMAANPLKHVQPQPDIYFVDDLTLNLFSVRIIPDLGRLGFFPFLALETSLGSLSHIVRQPAPGYRANLFAYDVNAHTVRQRITPYLEGQFLFFFIIIAY